MVDYTEYIQSPEWHKKAEDAKRAAEYRCQVCNAHDDDVSLEAHHRTYERLGNERPGDITVLCTNCHELFTRHDSIAKHGLREFQREKLLAPIGQSVEKIAAGRVLRTGFADIDQLQILPPSNGLVVVASSPSMGRTGFVLKIAERLSVVDDAAVAFFTLQIPRSDLARRLISSRTRISYSRLVTGHLDNDQETAVESAKSELEDSALLVDDTPGLTPSLFRLICAKRMAKESLDLAVIDGAELMQGNDPSLRSSYYSIIPDLKNISRELSIPVIVTTQLDVPDTQRKRHHLAFLAKKYSQLPIADVLIFLYRDEVINPDTTDRRNILEANIAKNRFGSTGYIDLYWFDRTGTPFNLDRHEIEL